MNVGPFGDGNGEELFIGVVVNKTTGVAVSPLASWIGDNACGVIVSVKFCSDLVFELSENFSENTSLMSCCISGDSGDSVWLMIPFEMLICSPAWLTTASGVSVVLSNRI